MYFDQARIPRALRETGPSVVLRRHDDEIRVGLFAPPQDGDGAVGGGADAEPPPQEGAVQPRLGVVVRAVEHDRRDVLAVPRGGALSGNSVM